MTRISQKKERCPKNGYFDKKIKNFHKSKIDGLQKLSTRAPRFYDFLHFKGWPFINHKISQQIFGKFCFLNLRSLKYIIIVQKINISTIGNFFIFFLGFQTLCIEIGLLWVKIMYLKSAAILLTRSPDIW